MLRAEADSDCCSERSVVNQLDFIHQGNAEQRGVSGERHSRVRIFAREDAAGEIEHVFPHFRINLRKDLRFERSGFRILLRKTVSAGGEEVESNVEPRFFEFRNLAEETVEFLFIECDACSGFGDPVVEMMQTERVHPELLQAQNVVFGKLAVQR